MKNNDVVKRRAHEKGIFLWQVADAVGVHYQTLTTWLRHELPEERFRTVMCAIDEVAAGKEKEDDR